MDVERESDLRDSRLFPVPFVAFMGIVLVVVSTFDLSGVVEVLAHDLWGISHPLEVAERLRE